jgi:hypothetical protein
MTSLLAGAISLKRPPIEMSSLPVKTRRWDLVARDGPYQKGNRNDYPTTKSAEMEANSGGSQPVLQYDTNEIRCCVTRDFLTSGTPCLALHEKDPQRLLISWLMTAENTTSKPKKSLGIPIWPMHPVTKLQSINFQLLKIII